MSTYPPRWGLDTPIPRPTHPDLTGQADEIVNAIFDRILRDEGKWQIVDAALAKHSRDQMRSGFDAHEFSEL